jgi:hypothetical protein
LDRFSTRTSVSFSTEFRFLLTPEKTTSLYQQSK